MALQRSRLQARREGYAYELGRTERLPAEDASPVSHARAPSAMRARRSAPERWLSLLDGRNQDAQHRRRTSVRCGRLRVGS
jgi:hypothetical protein